MVRIDDLSKEISNQLSRYTEQVAEEIEVAKDVVTKETVKELKRNSPKNTGSYAKGWTRKKVGKDIVVHNRTDYQLTHLLEHGHANKNGGRTPGQAHIRPAEEKAIKEFTERVERAVKG
jgi:hypothetical protein